MRTRQPCWSTFLEAPGDDLDRVVLAWSPGLHDFILEHDRDTPLEDLLFESGTI
jgi:hypothetical protein